MGMVEMPGMWSCDEIELKENTSLEFQENIVTLMQLKQPKMY